MAPIKSSSIRAIAWLPTKKSDFLKVLTIHGKEEQFKTTTIYEHLKISWSALGGLSVAGKNVDTYDPSTEAFFENDISIQMKKRAIAGYSNKAIVNVELLQDNPSIRNVWSMINGTF